MNNFCFTLFLIAFLSAYSFLFGYSQDCDTSSAKIINQPSGFWVRLSLMGLPFGLFLYRLSLADGRMAIGRIVKQ